MPVHFQVGDRMKHIAIFASACMVLASSCAYAADALTGAPMPGEPGWKPNPMAWRQPGESVVHYLRRYTMMPPAEYVRPFSGELETMRPKPGDHLKLGCPETSLRIGCTFPYPPRYCRIALVDVDFMETYSMPYQLVWLHENAHCVTWPASHPGRRGLTEDEIAKLLRGEKLVPWVPMK
jgi:hypothetical protein